MTRRLLTLRLLVMVVAIVGCRTAAVDGGPCAYDEFVGECITEGDGDGYTFTFRGEVRGREVVAPGNVYRDGPRATSNDSRRCSLRLRREGHCTPCLLSEGTCGEAASQLR